MADHGTLPSGPPRDFIGYGRRPPTIEWPGGAPVALSLVVNYEEGSEKSFSNGDGVNDGLAELNHRGVLEGVRDLATETVYEYGSRAGIFRLFRLFEQCGVKSTIYAAAVALERNPEVGEWMAEAGHEPCNHGWRWADDWKLTRVEQKDMIQRAIDSMQRTVGRRPVGMYSRYMPSIHTRELLVEEGGFIYDSESANDDLPYYVPVLGKQHLVVPYSLTHNDVHYVTGYYSSPAAFVDYCTRGLDYLCNEPDQKPRMMSIGLHGRWSGQPSRASAVRDIIEFAQDKGAWIATRQEIAEWWLQNYPPATA